MKILLVEDDQNLCKLLQSTLERRQYQVDVAIDGQAGWELAEAFPYDLILLDWMLPRLDGISFCKQLRSQQAAAGIQLNQETPVLLMTAMDAVTSRIIGLDAGADDYLVKPLDLEELQAHIRALERRGRGQRTASLEWRGLKLHPQKCEVTYAGIPIVLTFKEYQLIELLLRHPHQIFSQGRLIEHLWTSDETPTENAVRAQVKGLRQKLKQAGAGDVIETIYKLGYRLRQGKPDADEDDQSQASGSPAIVPSPVPELLPSDPAPPAISPATSIPPEFWQVWVECRQSYLERVALLQQAIEALQGGQLSTQLQHQAEREAHTLVGSLGSFGLDQASRLARQVQQLLKQDAPLGEPEIQLLEQIVPQLHHLISGSGEEPAPEPAPITTRAEVADHSQPTTSPAAPVAQPEPTLLIVDDDVALAHLLAAEAIPWGLHPTIASNLTQARQLLVSQPPQIVLLDLTLSGSGESGLDFLTELQLAHPTLPVLVFTAREGLTDRVQAARLGCKGFFQKPIAPNHVLAMVAQTLQQAEQTHAKLLIVDDDPLLLALLQELLAPEGYDLTLLQSPDQFWTVLEQTAPDLLILDVELQDSVCRTDSMSAELSGFDLCQIIRNDPHWSKLPILFLSGCTAPRIIQRGFEAGADDFLSKPIAPAELLTRVRKRLEQGQNRRQAEIDELTGLGNRRKSLRDLSRLLRLAQRQQQPYSLAVLDLDYFKQVNDQYGHEMGDRVLNCFGNLLKQSFRQEDVVGRWGGEEFVVGLYGTAKADGVKRLTEVLQLLSQQTFTAADGRQFQVTFSGGIAQLPSDGDDLQGLYRTADAALYQAKVQGRQRILEATQQG